MKIAVIGASGRAGSRILAEALKRGHETSAIVRDVYIVPDPHIRVIESDIHDLRYEDIAEQDVVINAFGVWQADKVGQHVTSLTHLSDILSGRKTPRLIVVGGAGSLYVDEEMTTRIVDLPDFPKGAYPVVSRMCEAYDLLCRREDFSWTYVSPAPDFKPDGESDGIYRIGGDVVPRNARGKSEISYADYAVAVLDEAENQRFIRRRITVYTP